MSADALAAESIQHLRAALLAVRAAAETPADVTAVRAALETTDTALREAERCLDSLSDHMSGRMDVGLLHKAVRDTNAALEEKLEELSLLRLVTDATSRAVRAADPFRLLLDKIVRLLGAENGSVMLVDWATRQLVVRAACGEKDDSPHMPRFELGEGIAGRVAQSGVPMIIPDCGTDERYVHLSGRSQQCGSLLCFPLTVQNQTIGVINLSASKPHTFSRETERMCHIIAGQLAVAIENSRLYDEIKETKDYLENLVERAGAAIFTLDRRGIVNSWNTGARDMYRLAARDVVGRGPEAFVPAPDLAQVNTAIQIVLHDGGVESLLAAGQRGDGQLITTDLTLSPIRDSSGNIVGVSGIGKDISKQKQIEEELRSLNEAKSNFISMVSHELRTPLTSIKSFVEIMLDDSAPTPQDTQHRYFNIINEECDRLNGLISDLLHLQKVEAGAFELDQTRIVMATVVEHALEMYAPVAERQNIALRADLRDSSPPGAVHGDRDRLFQVLGNLLSNAFKFTPEGGTVTVQQDTMDQEIRVTVSDTGPGLAAHELEKVFEKFYQVENTMTRHVEGTGLGLAICREIVKAHGGQIWADSAPGCGATFGVRLPRLLDPA